MAPRFGLAYDLTGAQRMVLRGGIGLFHDRPAGDTMYSQVGNPRFLDVADGALRAAAAAVVGPRDSGAAAAHLGLAVRSGHSVVHAVERRRADDAAVGVDARRLVRRPARLQPAARDPRTGRRWTSTPSISARRSCRRTRIRRWRASSTPGATAYSTDLLRPYRGLGQIGFNFPDFHETYHSIQASLNRRFRDGIAFGAQLHARPRLGTATSACCSGCSTVPTAPTALRADQAEYEELNKDMGNRRHLLKANFLWDLPNLSSTSQAMKAVGAAGERLAALRYPDGRIRRAVRHRLLVPERRRRA